MRCENMIRAIIPWLVLPLIGGCEQPQYLSADTPDKLPVLQGTSNARDAVSGYTSHPRATVRSEVIALAVADTFSPYERAQIARAVDKWNVVLNGFVRFEIIADETAAKSNPNELWVFNAKQGSHAGPSNALAVVKSHPAISGGEIDIYVRRIGRRDLGGVVLHELGHALGLGHDNSGLMAEKYHPSRQRCVDKKTVEAVATQRGLPLAQFNWCEDG